MKSKIEIMDTTLRDGEQTSGVSFSENEKVSVAKLLLESLKIDRIEVASARVSEGEFKCVQKITQWASDIKHLDKIEILGFVDGKCSIDWIVESGAKVLNLLSKGSFKHLKGQLRKTPEEHISDIKYTLAYADKKGIEVNIYLEDWSNGMINSPDYVWFMIDNLKDTSIKRFMLPDTLGILNNYQTHNYLIQCIEKYPNLHFDFHGHNDYDLAVSNVLAAVKAGVKGIHTTINGLGERAGNASFASVVAVLNDHEACNLNINEENINFVSHIVETYSGIRVPPNKPVTGESVFTQTSGVHADGDNKDNLYYNNLLPERFGRKRMYALGKLSGKANIKKNLDELGITLDDELLKEVTQKVVLLGDKKEIITAEDLPYIVSDVLNTKEISQNIILKDYNISSSSGLRPMASIQLEINKEQYEGIAYGDGQYDAFMNAVKNIYKKIGKKIPELIDYNVSIPPGGKSDALVDAVIKWRYNGQNIKTRAISSDQTYAAMKATLKMLNIMEMNYNK